MSRRRKGTKKAEAVSHVRGSTFFSKDPKLSQTYYVLKCLREQPQFWDEFVLETTVVNEMGRKREPGLWGPAFLTFMMSGETAMQKFADTHISDRIWTELLGFVEPPDRQTVYLRFVEMEKLERMLEARDGIGPFAKLRNRLIQHAMKHDPEILRDVIFDGTSVQTHSALHKVADIDENGEVRPVKSRPRVERPEGGVASAGREEDHELSPDQVQEQIDQVREIRLDRGKDPNLPCDPKDSRDLLGPFAKLFVVGDAIYGSYDASAGVRMYQHPDGSKKKFWHGMQALLMSDRHSEGRIVELYVPCNVQEHVPFEYELQLLREITGGTDARSGAFTCVTEAELARFYDGRDVRGMTPDITSKKVVGGTLPRAVIGDKALSVRGLRRIANHQDVAVICDLRGQRGRSRSDFDTEWGDRHGVPRCPKCGGAGDVESAGMGWTRAHKKASIRFRCLFENLPECKNRVLNFDPDREPLLYGPISHLDPVYHALKAFGSPHEGQHDYGRSRYGTAGKDYALRPRRRGIPCMQLRSNAAGCLEWFRILLLHGFVGSHKSPVKLEVVYHSGEESLKILKLSRSRNGVLLPHGDRAVEAGLLWPNPPPGYLTWEERKAQARAERLRTARSRKATAVKKRRAAEKKPAKSPSKKR